MYKLLTQKKTSKFPPIWCLVYDRANLANVLLYSIPSVIYPQYEAESEFKASPFFLSMTLQHLACATQVNKENDSVKISKLVLGPDFNWILLSSSFLISYFSKYLPYN